MSMYLEIVRTSCAFAATLASLVIGIQLFRGKWLWFVVPNRQISPAARKKQTKLDKQRAKYVSFVAFGFAFSIATLALFRVFQIGGIEVLTTGFSVLCNISTIIYLICVIYCYKMVNDLGEDPKSKFAAGNTRTNIFILVTLVALVVLSVLYAFV